MDKDWRQKIITKIEELAQATGLSEATLCHKIGRDGEIYSRLLAGRGMDADKAVAFYEKLWRETQKARRAKK